MPPEIPGTHFTNHVHLRSGGFGSVARCTHIPSGQTVAVKSLMRNADPDARVRFEREIAAMDALRHPHIVPILSRNMRGEVQSYTMPVYEHGSLRSVLAQVVEQGQLLDVSVVIRLGIEVASALQFAHARGVIHRDIKPDNILVDAEEKAVVGDWGLAKLPNAAPLTRRGGRIGTEGYAAPEQWIYSDSDQRSDVYSLGITLLEMTTGSRERSALSQVPEQYRAVIGHMIESAPAARPQSMKQVRDELTTGTVQRVAAPPAKVAAADPIPWGKVLATAAVAVAAVGAVVYLARRRPAA